MKVNKFGCQTDTRNHGELSLVDWLVFALALREELE